MEEPSLRTSRQAIALAIAVSLLLGGIGFLVGRNTAPPPDSPKGEASEPVVVPPAELLAGPMSRAELLQLAGSAADAAGSGGGLPDSLRQSAGRRFELRLPLGCGGAAAPDDTAGWTYDERGGRLRVFATPVRWQAAEWGEQGSETAVEEIEGFWIVRPWTSSDACPPDAPPMTTAEEGETEPSEPLTAASPPAAQTLAIGQVRNAESPRSGRRAGDLFETVLRVPAEQLDTSQGFRLRLIGRLSNAMGGAPVTCRADAPSARPVCLVTATFDEVAIENPATGAVLATWALGQRDVSAAD